MPNVKGDIVKLLKFDFDSLLTIEVNFTETKTQDSKGSKEEFGWAII